MTKSKRYDYFYECYLTNAVNIADLNRLVSDNQLTQNEVDTMVNDRMEQYGY